MPGATVLGANGRLVDESLAFRVMMCNLTPNDHVNLEFTLLPQERPTNSNKSML